MGLQTTIIISGSENLAGWIRTRESNLDPVFSDLSDTRYSPIVLLFNSTRFAGLTTKKDLHKGMGVISITSNVFPSKHHNYNTSSFKSFSGPLQFADTNIY